MLLQDALSKLMYHKTVLEEDIRKGTALMKQGNAPLFLQETIGQLNKILSETIPQAELKYKTLKVQF